MVNIITSTRLNNISYTLPSVFKDHSKKVNINGDYQSKDENGFTITCDVNVQLIGNYEGTEDLLKEWQIIMIPTINWLI